MSTDIEGLTTVNLPEASAVPDTDRKLPATRRILKADGVDMISFTFSPDQVLGDHSAPYPITVQCLNGEVDFSVEGTTLRMEAGMLLHLEEGIPHHVQATPEATEPATILVSLLTGERGGTVNQVVTGGNPVSA
ncbi:hypothetical protein CFAEC_08885 [Corynebacterium faecale]|uniref:cupin domain-containing protein n=1 Tax=Corynebacterium faecale TaxID=1758466 RepID=UPI0025B43CDA|nr:cupin domain-containing protein [Corynebacterium faecale]WJY92594.1 hypothetical protein CFAEC_08885 [Corynebacterium faecale]